MKVGVFSLTAMTRVPSEAYDGKLKWKCFPKITISPALFAEVQGCWQAGVTPNPECSLSLVGSIFGRNVSLC